MSLRLLFSPCVYFAMLFFVNLKYEEHFEYHWKSEPVSVGCFTVIPGVLEIISRVLKVVSTMLKRVFKRLGKGVF